jgi:flavin reductase (DIM6/NTAB) family NADH-FMN oxidoreductase RutF
MREESYYYEPRNGHGLRHDPLNAIIAPRPIGWISSRSSAGRLNLAPYSFFNALNYKPPIIAFSSIGRKDSLRNIEETGEFVWNLVTRPLADAMNVTSAPVPPDVNEFALAGLTPAASYSVAVPRVAESPVAFECRATQIVQLLAVAGGKIDTWLVLGEVVGVHIARALVAKGVYETAAADPVLRGGGLDSYFAVSEAMHFRLARPSAARAPSFDGTA